MNTLFRIFLLAAILSGGVAQAQQPNTALASTTAASGRELSVTGEATGHIAPNIARVTVVIEETGNAAKDAVDAANKKQEALKKVLEAAGAGALTIRDEQFSGATPGSAISKSAIIRFKRALIVEAKELSAVSGIIDAALGAGITAVPTVEYLVRHQEEKIQEILSEATKNALAKAQAVAKSANVTLGEVSYITVTEEPDAQVLREDHQLGANLTPYSDKEVHALVTVGVELK